MNPLAWIVLSASAMSMIAWVGLVLVALGEDVLMRFLRVLAVFAAGALMAGAFLHLIPEAVQKQGTGGYAYMWMLTGLTLFLLMEQRLHWQHDHRLSSSVKVPVTYLILPADGLHNVLGGLAIGGSFHVSPRVGIITWVVAAAHEIPQEFGDFTILVPGGWNKKRALLLNFVSALTIVPGNCLPIT